MSDDHFIHFIIGSSPIMTFFPYIFFVNSYNNLNNFEKSELPISLETLLVIFPILSGVLFTGTFYVLEQFIPVFPRKVGQLYTRYILAGVISNVILGFICHYIFHIQDKWMKMEEPFSSHVVITVVYFVLFYTLGVWLRNRILYGSSSPSSSSSSSPSSSSSFSPSSSSPNSSPLPRPQTLPYSQQFQIPDSSGIQSNTFNTTPRQTPGAMTTFDHLEKMATKN